MIKLILVSIMMLSYNVQAKTESKLETKSSEYSKIVTVNGMVCAFCSNSLEKKFKKEKAVENINVDLESRKVSIKFKSNKTISDKKLKKIIKSSGFVVVSIVDTQKLQATKDINNEK